MTKTNKCTIYRDPFLIRQSTGARFRGIITSLEAKIAELEAQEPETITVQVPVEKIVEKIVHVEVPVDRVVEVPVEVEKIVEKTVEVPVDRIVEVPVEVEKIVEVIKTVEVPVEVEKIVERVVEVEVDKVDIAFNRKYIQILQDHIKDLNEFAIDSLSEDASSP